MSDENVELVRQVLNRWIEVDEGLADLDRLYEFFAPDVIFDIEGGPETSPLRGLDQFVEWRASVADSYDEWGYETEQILDAGGNQVVATFHARGQLRDSASWIEMHYGIVYTVKGGLITSGVLYLTTEQALEAAGVSE